MTIRAASRRYGRSQGWFSSIETGVLPVRLDELLDLLDFYGVTDPEIRESLSHLARQDHRQNWTSRHKKTITPTTLDLASLESDSASIRMWQPILIPGLLQSEPYVRAVMAAGFPRMTADVEGLVAFRLARQKVLTRPDPPACRVIIGEAALHQRVGDPDVMRDQLRHLVDLAHEHDHIAIHVLPTAAGAYNGVAGPFHLCTQRPPGLLTVAIVDQTLRPTFAEDKDTVSLYEEVFDHILTATLDAAASLDLIQQLATTT